MATAYDYIESNKRKSLIWAALFPVSLMAFAFFTIWLMYFLWGVCSYFHPTNIFSWQSIWHNIWQGSLQTSLWALPLCGGLALFWSLQALQQGDQIVLEAIPSVRMVDKWDAYDACTLLENLCLTTGDYLPKLYVLEDDSMNAFSVGMTPMHSAIVVSSGLLKHLDRVELEAVLAHELAHIRHYDTRLMVVLTVCVAFFTFCGEWLYYGEEKDNWIGGHSGRGLVTRRRFPLFVYLGAMLMGYGYIIAPFLRFAWSKQRDFLADAQAALTTRHPRALIKALWHINRDSRIEVLEGQPMIGAMCIARPDFASTIFTRLSGLEQAHPPLEERVLALNDMDGLFLEQQ